MNKEQKQLKQIEKIEPLISKNEIYFLQSNPIYSTFGKTIQSNIKTEPEYSFGKAERQAPQKTLPSKMLKTNIFLSKNKNSHNYTSEISEEFLDQN